jgi:hypothetical protein
MKVSSIQKLTAWYSQQLVEGEGFPTSVGTNNHNWGDGAMQRIEEVQALFLDSKMGAP